MMNGKIKAGLTLALFAALAFAAWKSGRRVYETGPRLEIRETENAVIFRWAHDVEAPMAERFAAAFEERRRRAGPIVIELNSPGGSLAEGRLVIDEIERAKRNFRISTRVNAEEFCLSMCVPIYLRGETRIAASSAIFMFHEPTSRDLFTDAEIDKPGFERRMTSAKFFERYFVNSEMKAEWRETLRENWKGRDLWYTASELVALDSGVVQELE